MSGLAQGRVNPARDAAREAKRERRSGGGVREAFEAAIERTSGELRKAIEGHGDERCDFPGCDLCRTLFEPPAFTRSEMIGYGERVKAEIANQFDPTGRVSSRWAHEVVTGTALPELP